MHPLQNHFQGFRFCRKESARPDSAELKTELKSTVSGKEITLTDALEEGTGVVVFYGVTREDVYNINIKSTSFPKAFAVYGDTYLGTVFILIAWFGSGGFLFLL